MENKKRLIIIKKITIYLSCIIIFMFCLWGLYGTIFYKEAIVFEGPNFYKVGYYTDLNEEKTEFLNSGDIIELNRNEGDIVYVSIKWECFLKYYKDENDLPTIKFLDHQAIIYKIYLNNELISTNYKPETTKYEIATITNNNGFFRWESKTSYATSIKVDTSKSGSYKIVSETKVFIDDEERFYYNEFSFDVIDS